MFGLIRILLLLVIIAAVALLIRPDLIEMAGLSGSKPTQEKESVAAPSVAETGKETPEATSSADADSAETAEKAASEEPATPPQSETTAESGIMQESAPAHDPETLKQSDAEWGFDSSQETSPVSESATPEEPATHQQSDTAAETVAPQPSAPAHDPDMLKQSEAEWGFDSSTEAKSAPVTEAGPAAVETPTPKSDVETAPTDQSGQSGFDEESAPVDAGETTDSETKGDAAGRPAPSMDDEAALRQWVDEMQQLAADIIDNPDQK